ncbi:hypothetical protein RFI_14562 [Reticulomyxa filosa]|uniref:Uncharacterized protein n=1 Tax=Reticulomyxa filosa TaxID=46433 RepID=X6N9A0_RETFI|nr:hypothetical protein RFI_14562 [Reticulomyxa filosa]|eukprot:ETO22631.1 hypothetical protein RFI_14562 [Reticulomyxa filosa]
MMMFAVIMCHKFSCHVQRRIVETIYDNSSSEGSQLQPKELEMYCRLFRDVSRNVEDAMKYYLNHLTDQILGIIFGVNVKSMESFFCPENIRKHVRTQWTKIWSDPNQVTVADKFLLLTFAFHYNRWVMLQSNFKMITPIHCFTIADTITSNEVSEMELQLSKLETASTHSTEFYHKYLVIQRTLSMAQPTTAQSHDDHGDSKTENVVNHNELQLRDSWQSCNCSECSSGCEAEENEDKQDMQDID